MFKVNNKNTRTRQYGRGVVLVFFIVNFQHIKPFSSVSFVDFEQVNFSWVGYSRIHGK